MSNKKNILKAVSLFVVTIIMAGSWHAEDALAYSGESEEIVMWSSEDDPYENVAKISLADFFNQGQDDYYVYFYMVNCPYCNQVKDQMLSFAADAGNVYFVDYLLAENRPTQKYSWAETCSKYNKKIGYIDDYGNKVFLDGESEEKYLNMQNEYGKIMRFDFVTITPDNINSFPGASIGDVYTDVQTPEIDYYSMRSYEDILIAGVPSLFRVNEGRIIEFYFDSPEIAEFLNNID